MPDNAWTFLSPLLWIATVIAVSAWYRRFKGKAIFPRVPVGAQFAEKGCSGRSRRNVISRIGGASNCLLVVIRDNRLLVTPQFPFNLMFLPEIYGMDLNVPVDVITGITPVKAMFRKALRVDFKSDGPASIDLVVHDENAFTKAIGHKALRSGSRDIDAPVRPRKSWKLLRMRLFFAAWCALALFVTVGELREDLRYRQDGRTVVGTYVDPVEQIDGQSKSGVLTYKIDGTTYRLGSLWGVGLYKVGEEEAVYYLPSDPNDARESGSLQFDLAGLGLGVMALAIAIFGGAVARRVW